MIQCRLKEMIKQGMLWGRGHQLHLFKGQNFSKQTSQNYINLITLEIIKLIVTDGGKENVKGGLLHAIFL